MKSPTTVGASLSAQPLPVVVAGTTAARVSVRVDRAIGGVEAVAHQMGDVGRAHGVNVGAERNSLGLCVHAHEHGTT